MRLMSYSLLACLFVSISSGCDRAAHSSELAATTCPAAPAGMVLIPGGTFEMGTNEGFPYEGPAHTVTVKPYFLDEHEVTVADFEKFVAATGYKTEAEKYG